MVTIRLSRGGSKKRPFYSILVADQRRSTRGRYIERIGFFAPLARGNEDQLRLNIERCEHWVGLGAEPSERVKQLYKQAKSATSTSAATTGTTTAATKSVEPTESAESVEPVESVEPAESAESVESVEPAEPTESAEPTKH